MKLRDAGEAYARQGWPVFPCRARSKEPLVTGGFKTATTDLEQVREWWSRWPAANIGCPPGRAGLLVIDVDGPEGEESARREGLFSEPTLTVQTARGWHLYFKHPGGTIGNRRIAPGLDVRADAGYVLLPPSVHPSGHVYRVVQKVGVAPAPTLLLQASTPPPAPWSPPDPINAGTPRRRAYVVAAIERECLELARTPEGGRNHRLNEASFSLSRFVATGEADPGKLADVLSVAARHAGLSEIEIAKTIASAFGARGVTV